MSAANVTFGNFNSNEKAVYVNREAVGSIYREVSRRCGWAEYRVWIHVIDPETGEADLVSRSFYGNPNMGRTVVWPDGTERPYFDTTADEAFTTGPKALAAAKRWAKATAQGEGL